MLMLLNIYCALTYFVVASIMLLSWKEVSVDWKDMVLLIFAPVFLPVLLVYLIWGIRKYH